MQYKHAKEQLNYSDFSSGRVFYSLPGHPAFPVRLASEIFQRCIAHREALYRVSTPCALYDPCCGTAYHLSVLGYLHGEYIRKIIGSDIDEKAVALAKRNLALLSTEGLDQRFHEIVNMLEKYGKESHKEALSSASILKARLTTLTENHRITTQVFQASAADRFEVSKYIQPKSVDIVFSDVPYGQHSKWWDADASNALGSMLDTLLDVLSPSSIIAVASDKGQKAFHESYQRLEQFQVGKRRIAILKPIHH